MNFPRSHGLYYTSIDAPEDSSIVPSFIEATGDQVYFRFHGKNRENWFKRNITAAERFKYLYSELELPSLAKGFGNRRGGECLQMTGHVSHKPPQGINWPSRPETSSYQTASSASQSPMMCIL
jgi:hypothetical protein